jgi:hypothetical protein
MMNLFYHWQIQKKNCNNTRQDFGELVFRLKQAHHGVILIRLHGYAPASKADITTSVLLAHKDELTEAFTVIQPNAIRIRN